MVHSLSLRVDSILVVIINRRVRFPLSTLKGTAPGAADQHPCRLSPPMLICVSLRAGFYQEKKKE